MKKALKCKREGFFYHDVSELKGTRKEVSVLASLRLMK